MNTIDETWTRKVLHRHYHRYRKQWKSPDSAMIEVLRIERWRRMRVLIGKEIEAIMPTVLTPPEQEREQDHETVTVVDKSKTEAVHEPH